MIFLHKCVDFSGFKTIFKAHLFVITFNKLCKIVQCIICHSEGDKFNEKQIQILT